MFETIIDQSTIEAFFSKRPLPVPEGSNEDNVAWLKFFDFIQNKSHLQINGENIKSLSISPFAKLLTALTTGRGESNLSLSRFKKPHKQKFSRLENPHSFFFFDESKEQMARYRKQNGYVISNSENLIETWNNIIINKLPLNIAIRQKVYKEIFKDWNELEKWLLPFTDIVLVDPFIFSDQSLLESNLLQILIKLNNATPVKFNLSLITFEGNREPKIKIQQIVDWLQKMKASYNLKMNFSVLLEKQQQKEHDRGIFMNYLRVKSGDSFNLFKSNGELATKGTELDFYPLVEKDKLDTAKTILLELSEKATRTINNEQYSYGEHKNSLLNLG